MNIKYPRFHITEHPTDFYVFYEETHRKAMWSGWIKGNSNLWHRLNKMKPSQKERAIIKLANKSY